MSEKIQTIRDGIINAALPLVVFDGWSIDVLKQAAEEAGYEADVAKAVFPNGVVGALGHFADVADRQMLQALKNINPEDLRVRDRVRTALLERYAFLSPHKEAFKALLSYLAIPTRKPAAAKMVWRTADRIWDWAGDTSSDYNHYTKRGLLSGIIVSTSLVWLNDNSEDMEVTKAFLDRRIENVMKLGSLAGKVTGNVKRRFKGSEN